MLHLLEQTLQFLFSCGGSLINILFDLAGLTANCTYHALMGSWNLPPVHLPFHEIYVWYWFKELSWCVSYSTPVVGKVLLCHKVCNVC